MTCNVQVNKVLSALNTQLRQVDLLLDCLYSSHRWGPFSISQEGNAADTPVKWFLHKGSTQGSRDSLTGKTLGSHRWGPPLKHLLRGASTRQPQGSEHGLSGTSQRVQTKNTRLQASSVFMEKWGPDMTEPETRTGRETQAGKHNHNTRGIR